ncbi:CDP-glycerol glycerophosphotransferase family protein [Metaplanococcus flavidus]|uniref:CDP-glycerol glycerophosphotransferase family protein n=1 Tax=Metaplanococcus flavidus TaxID=569883 RepID=A0ABW3L9R0_9BACL
MILYKKVQRLTGDDSFRFANVEAGFLKKGVVNGIGRLKNNGSSLQLFKILFIVTGLLPKKRKLVIFESFHAQQYSDSPRAIYEYMKEHHPDYQLLWSVDKQAQSLFQDFGVPYLRRFSIAWFLNFPRAKYWVNNVRLPAWMPKPKKTVYIQTWHGTPLKKLGIDIEEIHMPGTNTSNYKKNFIVESSKWDYLVSPNSYSSEIFRRAFHYQGKIIESGYPRNDLLSRHSTNVISHVKKQLGIPEDKKIMLYAPTWRDNEFYEKGKYKFKFQFDLDKWQQEFGEEWVLLSRMHYLVAENFDFSAYEGTVFNVSSYPDIRELYLMADLMITDYSSVFFDFAILDRPIVFFMYDLDLYRDQLRGFYFDIEKEAPGPIAETEAELFDALNNLKDSDVQLNPKFSVFKEKFSSLEDGNAAERVVQAFLE